MGRKKESQKKLKEMYANLQAYGGMLNGYEPIDGVMRRKVGGHKASKNRMANHTANKRANTQGKRRSFL